MKKEKRHQAGASRHRRREGFTSLAPPPDAPEHPATFGLAVILGSCAPSVEVKVDKGRPKVPGKVRVQFCHFCFAAPSIQNTWRKILLPPRRAAKVRADARPPAACTPARVVRGRLPTWGAGRARWQPGAPKQVFPFSAMYFCMEGAQKWQN